MQEEIEQKSFNIMISTTKLSARTVLRAVKAAFRLYQSKTSQGKQSVRTLLRQNRGVSSVEISKTGIRGLERYAKKYGIDYAIRKDTSEVPPRYGVAGLTVDPDQNKLVLDFCRKLEDETLADWYDQMFYFVRSEMECYAGMEKLAQDIESDEDWGPTIFDESEEEELIDDV